MQAKSNGPELAHEETPEANVLGNNTILHSRGFQARITPVRTPHGTEVYIYQHLPAFVFPKLKRFSLPGGREGIGISMSTAPIPEHALTMSAIALAVAAQVLIYNQYILPGLLLYLASAAELIVWATRNPAWKGAFAHQFNVPIRTEAVLFGILVLATIFTRLYDLRYRVYALESDESKWTAQSWYSTILHTDYGEFHAIHYRFLPVDFWVRSIFLRIFGVSYANARLESAFISVIAIIFLYHFVRLLLKSPAVAFLSALLYGFSFAELTASHQALHSSPLELWLMPGLYALVITIQSKKRWHFQLTGILMALGMLTYETFWPTAGFAAMYLLWQGRREVSNKKDTLANWLINLGLMAWPMLLAYIFFIHGYFFNRYAYYYRGLLPAFSSASWLDNFNRLLHNAEATWGSTFSQVSADQFIDWGGPLVNPMLLPFVAIGLIYTFWNIRQPGYAFLLFFYLFQIIPAPIIFSSPYPRVLYTSLAALVIWGALGLWALFAALRALLDTGSLQRLAAPVFLFILAAVLINDYHIFTSSLNTPEEEIRRRELADFTAASAKNAEMILFPYTPYQNNAVELESNVILFSVGGARGVGLEASQNYRQLEFLQLLPTLWEMRALPNLDIIFEKSQPSIQDDRDTYLQTVLTCYPAAKLTASGRYFDVYHIPGQSLAQPYCYTWNNLPRLLEPQSGSQPSGEQPLTLSWDAAGIPFTSFEVTLERTIPDLHWIEVENNFQGLGWMTNSGFANNYHGAGFLLDSWNAKTATFLHLLPREETYHAWIRYYKRQDTDQQTFLTLPGKAIPFAGNGGPLYEWVWQDLGAHSLPSGQLPIGIYRTYPNDAYYSLFIDTLLLTSAAQYNPNTDSIVLDKYQSGEIIATTSQFTLPAPLPPGDYRWKVRLFDKNRLVDVQGARGLESNFNSFTIVP
ncbi:MAG: ArnT family glycosyltransferase [Chloroflexota bacterium]